jgi:hypothetical protein
LGEIKILVQEIHDCQEESKLEPGTRDREMAAMQKKIEQYNVAELGDLPQEQEDGTMRILVCQMGGCASTETREIKKAATKKLIQKYDVNLCLFMELNFNWSKVTHQQIWLPGSNAKKEKCDASQPTTSKKMTSSLENINLGEQGCYVDTNTYSM